LGLADLDEIGLAGQSCGSSSPLSKQAKESPRKPLATRPQIERLFSIIAKITNHEADTVDDLAASFEVNRRTILRDIEFLRDRLGVEIVYDTKDKCYVIEQQFKHLPPLEVTETDLLVLTFLKHCLSPYRQTEIGREMYDSFRRMFGLLSGSRQWHSWEQYVWFRFEKAPSGAERELYRFHTLHRAIAKRRQVCIEYKSRGKPLAKLVICPQLLTLHKGRWYLYGWNSAISKEVALVLGRMGEITQLEDEFNPRELPDPRKLLQLSFGAAISESEPMEIILEFEKTVVERVKETQWHNKQTLEDLQGGGVRLTLHLSCYLDLQPWILSWGPYVKVVQPECLKSTIASAAKRMAGLYK
jgi:predicted DNA-binding transcriptional regulator YafY